VLSVLWPVERTSEAGAILDEVELCVARGDALGRGLPRGASPPARCRTSGGRAAQDLVCTEGDGANLGGEQLDCSGIRFEEPGLRATPRGTREEPATTCRSSLRGFVPPRRMTYGLAWS